MEFTTFYNKHKDEKILVIGCGESAKLIKNHPLLCNVVTIGVNDICRLMTPKYLVVVDTPKKFNGERHKFVSKTAAEYVFTQINEWKIFPPARKILFKLGNNRLGHLQAREIIDYSNNSPYVASIIAYKMGASEIGLVGVDFTLNHFYAKDGEHILIKTGRMASVEQDFKKLAREFKKNRVDLVNLSPTSKLTSVPKMDLIKFLNT